MTSKLLFLLFLCFFFNFGFIFSSLAGSNLLRLLVRDGKLFFQSPRNNCIFVITFLRIGFNLEVFRQLL